MFPQELVVGGIITAIDNDGHYSIRCDDEEVLLEMRRGDLCHKWQIEEGLWADKIW